MEKMSEQEFEKTILEIINERNIMNAQESVPCHTLWEMLDSRNIMRLRAMAKAHFIRDYLKMNKSALISALTQKMLDKDFFWMVLSILDDDDWAFFKSAALMREVRGEYVVSDDFMGLVDIGLVGLYRCRGKLLYVVPREIRKLFEELVEEDFFEQKERVDLIRNYALAAVNLYGVIELNAFIDLFNSQNEEDKTNTDETAAILKLCDQGDFAFRLHEGCLVHADLDDEDLEDMQAIKDRAARTPRYVPPKEEFLKYSDLDYVEPTPEIAALRAHIAREWTDDSDMADELAEEIALLSRGEEEIQAYIELLAEYDIRLNNRGIKALWKHIADIHNNMRSWYNGRTPNEAQAEEAARDRETIRAGKPGRNAPCPCGSGKKYKNCCGRA